MCLLLKCTNLLKKNSKGLLFHVLCFCFNIEGKRRPGQERWEHTSIGVV